MNNEDSRIAGRLILVGVGAFLLLRNMDFFYQSGYFPSP